MTTLFMEEKTNSFMGLRPTSDEMICSVLVKMDALEPRRKYMFMAWLHAHSSQMKRAANIREGLGVWFESMPCENAQWEYRLVLQEIEWWREQSEQKVELLMLDYFSERLS